jgi:hypothetical protein
MFWTMMNATNLTMAQKIELLKNAPLDNTDYVVIEGNAEDGWKLVNWNGQQFGTDTTLAAEVQLQMRTLTRQLAATAKQVVDAFATLNPATVIAAIIRGVGDATASIAKFAGAVTNKAFQELGKLGAPSQPAQTTNVSALAASAATSTPNPVTANDPAARTIATPSATANAVVGDTRKVEPTKGAGTEVTPSTDDATTPTSTEATNATKATKPEPVEAPKAPATNGATDLKDGNKTTPGSTATEHSTTGDKPAVGTGPSVDAGTAGTETASSESEGAAA